jgi:hypothetical protein
MEVTPDELHIVSTNAANEKPNLGPKEPPKHGMTLKDKFQMLRQKTLEKRSSHLSKASGDE